MRYTFIYSHSVLRTLMRLVYQGTILLILGKLFFPTVINAKAEKVYHHVMETSPKNLNPLQAATIDAANLIYPIYDTLFEYKYLERPLSIKPNLAITMPVISSNGLDYTIEIKKGIFFADDPCFKGGKGREVTTYDVAHMFKRHFLEHYQSNGRWLWENKIVGMKEWIKNSGNLDEPVKGITVINKHKIRITLVSPYPQFLATLTTSFSAIVPQEAFTFYGKKLSSHPVGSGPFTLKSIDNSKAVLVKNENYRHEYLNLKTEGFNDNIHTAYMRRVKSRKLPFVDEVVVHFIKEPSVMWNSFNKGNEIQISWVSNELLSNVTTDKKHSSLKKEYSDKYSFAVVPEFGFVYLEFNQAHPSFSGNEGPGKSAENKLLRCAIRSAYDWSNRNERIYSGLGEVFPGVIPPSLPSFDKQVTNSSTKQDLATSKMMLKLYSAKKPLPNIEYSDTFRLDARHDFELFRSWLIKAGYPKDKIKFKGFGSFTDFWQAKQQGELMLSSVSWSLDYPDAENVLQLYYSKNIGISNASRYNNPEFDRLFEKSQVTNKTDERLRLYRQMNEILIEDCALISGLVRKKAYIWHKNVVLYPNKEFMGNFFKYIDILE